jgi:hypothetical protein
VKKQNIYAGMQSNSRGFSIWTLSFNLLLLGAGLVLILRLLPGYVEYMTVKDLISQGASEHDARTDTIPDLRTRLAKLLTTNQINDTTIEDIRIYRERGVIVIDANYENRFSLVWILDGVMKFDDLIVETDPAGRT